jgi:hypothetical protein
MPNPNTLASIEDELRYYRKNLKNGIHSKSVKEYLLREIRTREVLLGIPSKPYNGKGDFSNV